LSGLGERLAYLPQYSATHDEDREREKREGEKEEPHQQLLAFGCIRKSLNEENAAGKRSADEGSDVTEHYVSWAGGRHVS
jgi:hypothetical protein